MLEEHKKEKLLHVLSVREDVASVLDTSGVLDALAVAMSSYPEHEMLQAYCCEFFCRPWATSDQRRQCARFPAAHLLRGDLST